MTFPRLNLKRFFCNMFEIELSAFLSNESYSALLETGTLSNFKMDGFNTLSKTYKVGRRDQTLIYMFHSCKEKKENTIHILTSFDYRQVSGKLEEKSKFAIDFTRMFSFFKKDKTVFTGHAISRFIFPLEKFEPIMQLPYSWEGPVADKRIEIRGFDLNVESNSQKYRQSISVEEKLIVENVGIFNIRDHLSTTLIENTFKDMFGFTQELIRRKKGARGAATE